MFRNRNSVQIGNDKKVILPHIKKNEEKSQRGFIQPIHHHILFEFKCEIIYGCTMENTENEHSTNGVGKGQQNETNIMRDMCAISTFKLIYFVKFFTQNPKRDEMVLIIFILFISWPNNTRVEC